MNDQSSPFTTGGTAHGIRIRTRVSRESHTRSSLMTRAMARPITTSRTTDAATNTRVWRRDSQNNGSSERRAKFARPAKGSSPERSWRMLTVCSER
jgi:hypothetical protein